MSLPDSNKQFFLTPQQLSKLVGVSTSTIRRWESEGVINSVRNSTGYRTYSNSAVEILNKHKQLVTVRKHELGLNSVLYTTHPDTNKLANSFSLLKASFLTLAIVLTGLLKTYIQAPDYINNATKIVKHEAVLGITDFRREKASIFSPQVLAEQTVKRTRTFTVNIATKLVDLTVEGLSTFNNDINAIGHNLNLGAGNITAGNIIYSLKAGNGVAITGTKDLTIETTDEGLVTSIGGETGDIELQAGTGITIDGLNIENTGVTSLTGTVKQVIVSAESGEITLTLPQDIATTSSPEFTNLTLSGLTDGFITSTNGVLSGGNVISLTSTVTGVLPVANGGTGLATLTNNYLYKGNGTSALAQSVIYDNGTNVGVGTTAPVGKLHVEGQCVALGTRIKRRRKKKNGLYEEDEISVENIQPGDEVLSLNEVTGRFEWQLVEKTMDKGIQTSYQLVTESGKQIETTNNHPYLALPIDKQPASFSFIDEIGVFENNKLMLFGVGVLTIKEHLFEINQKLHQIFVEAITFYNEPADKFELKFKYITPRNLIFYNRFIEVLAKHCDDWDFEFIFEKRNQEKFWTHYITLVKNIFEQKSNKYIVLADYLNKPKKDTTSFDDLLGLESVVNAHQLESQGSLLLQASDILLGAISCIKNNAKDKYKKEIALKVRDIFEQKNRAGVDSIYAALKFIIPEKSNLSSNATWTKVKDLKIGQKIAVYSQNRFEKVVSIKQTGRKQMYDLQIANTHNFVGNGIVAHNTYLQGAGTTTGFSLRTADSTGADKFVVMDNGNVGLGNTAPAYKLDVAGTARFTGDLRLTGGLYDTSASAGSSTNILTSTGTGTSWQSITSAISSTAFIQNGNSFTANAVLGTNDAYSLSLETGGVSKLYIDTTGNIGIGGTAPSASPKLYVGANGNVGIGTTGPKGLLDVAGTNITAWVGVSSATMPDSNTLSRLLIGDSAAANPGYFYLVSNDNDAGNNMGGIAFANYNLGTTEKRIALITGGSNGATNKGRLSFYTMNSGTLAEKLRLSTTGGLSLGSTYVETDPGAGSMIISGNVGIGTTSPDKNLVVVGDMRLKKVADSTKLYFGDDSDNYINMAYNDVTWNMADGNFTFAGGTGLVLR